MNHQTFVEKVLHVVQRDTSFDPEKWSPENPLWGHCGVISLLAQDVFGGELMRGSLQNIPKYKYLKYHYWNKIDGVDVDFTHGQFTDISYTDLESHIRSRESALEHKDTEERYLLLKTRFDNSYIVN